MGSNSSLVTYKQHGFGQMTHTPLPCQYHRAAVVAYTQGLAPSKFLGRVPFHLSRHCPEGAVSETSWGPMEFLSVLLWPTELCPSLAAFCTFAHEIALAWEAQPQHSRLCGSVFHNVGAG